MEEREKIREVRISRPHPPEELDRFNFLVASYQFPSRDRTPSGPIWDIAHTPTPPTPPPQGYRFLTSSTCSMSRKRDGQSCWMAKTNRGQPSPEHGPLLRTVYLDQVFRSRNQHTTQQNPPGEYFLSFTIREDHSLSQRCCVNGR